MSVVGLCSPCVYRRAVRKRIAAMWFGRYTVMEVMQCSDRFVCTQRTVGMVPGCIMFDTVVCPTSLQTGTRTSNVFALSPDCCCAYHCCH